MILVTHAVAGGAAALLFKSDPVAAFAAGFVSHFLLDAVPHWHYQLGSFVRTKDPKTKREDGYFIWSSPLFIRDVLATIIDCLSGIAIAVIALGSAPSELMSAVIIGAIGGVAPDFLQLLYYISPKSPLKYLQQFHRWIHPERRLDNEPLLGISSQLVILAAFTAIIFAY